MPKRKQPLNKVRKVAFRELGALYAVRAMIVSGVMTHERDCFSQRTQNAHTLNMGVAGECSYGCGTMSCIGGTMAIIMGLEPGNYVTGPLGSHVFDGINRSAALEDLFYPPGDMSSYYAITAKQMLAAIDNWLATGKPKWKSVLAK